MECELLGTLEFIRGAHGFAENVWKVTPERRGEMVDLVPPKGNVFALEVTPKSENKTRLDCCAVGTTKNGFASQYLLSFREEKPLKGVLIEDAATAAMYAYVGFCNRYTDKDVTERELFVNSMNDAAVAAGFSALYAAMEHIGKFDKGNLLMFDAAGKRIDLGDKRYVVFTQSEYRLTVQYRYGGGILGDVFYGVASYARATLNADSWRERAISWEKSFGISSEVVLEKIWKGVQDKLAHDKRVKEAAGAHA